MHNLTRYLHLTYCNWSNYADNSRMMNIEALTYRLLFIMFHKSFVSIILRDIYTLHIVIEATMLEIHWWLSGDHAWVQSDDHALIPTILSKCFSHFLCDKLKIGPRLKLSTIILWHKCESLETKISQTLDGPKLW